MKKILCVVLCLVLLLPCAAPFALMPRVPFGGFLSVTVIV